MPPTVPLASGRERILRTLLIHAAVVAVFGVFLPWRKGLDFLDPVIIDAYACLGIFFAAPAAVQAFAEERPKSLMAALARIANATVYGEGVTAAILLAAFITVFTTRLHSVALSLDVKGLAAPAALGLTASLALATVAAWITLRFSAIAARSALRVIFLLLLGLFLLRANWLPEVAGIAALLFLAVAALGILAVRSVLEHRP